MALKRSHEASFGFAAGAGLSIASCASCNRFSSAILGGFVQKRTAEGTLEAVEDQVSRRASLSGNEEARSRDIGERQLLQLLEAVTKLQ